MAKYQKKSSDVLTGLPMELRQFSPIVQVGNSYPGYTIANSGLHAKLIFGEPKEVSKLMPGVISDLENFDITL